VRLTDFALRNRTALLSVVALLILGGIAAYFALPVTIFPELRIPRLTVIASSGDTPPETMMVTVTRPIEQAIATLPHVRRMRSTTARGETQVTVDLDYHTDMIQSQSLLNTRLASLRSSLPAGTETQTEIMDPSLFPILGYSLSSTSLSQEDLYDLAEYTIRPRLARIPGLRQIQVQGTRIREVRVTLDPVALRSNGVSAKDVEDALRRANLVGAVGQFDESYQRHLVLIDNQLKGLATIRDVVVTVKSRVPVHVRDVGSVEPSAVPQNVAIAADGHRAVLISIIRQPTANAVVLSRAVTAAFREMKRDLPSDLTIRPFYDQSEIVLESERSVLDAVLLGALLAAIVMMLFLGSLRSALVVLLFLPVTLGATLLALLPLGKSLNIMTLGALAIALGLIIDDAVVVVENMTRFLEQGLPRREAVREAMRDIGPAMWGSSATTLVVFLPLLFLTGVTGDFFAPLALTMGVSLTVSLMLALFLAPVLGAKLLSYPHHRPGPAGQTEPMAPSVAGAGGDSESRGPGLLERMNHGYQLGLRWCLRHRIVILLMLVPLVLGTAWMAGQLKTGFMPAMDEGGFVLDYTMPPGTSLAETDRVCTEIGKMVQALPDVDSYSRRTGTQLGFAITSQNTGDFLVKLKPRGHRRPIDEVMDGLRGQIEGTFPACQVDFIQILQDLLGDMAGSPSPIEVKVFGPDMAVLEPLTRQIGKIVADTPGVVDEFDGITGSGPDVLMKVEGDRAAQAGLTAEEVSNQVNAALFGDVATYVRQGERQVGVRVAYPEGAYRSAAALAGLTLITPDGQSLPLSAVASTQTTSGSPELNREDQRLMCSVTARISGTDLGTAVRAIQAKVSRVPLPSGVTLEYGGLFASQQESFASLGTMLAVVALLTLCVLLFYFGSFAEAVALLGAGMLSLSGVVLGLWLTGTPLDISSFTGGILVIGIVVEGSLFLLDSARQQRQSGIAPEDALVSAGGLRLRPILMTKVMTILALTPLALGLGAGAEMQKPLAIAVIGGVLLSGLFTLFVTPALYVTIARRPAAAANGDSA
jgi:multidrug efflux pump subunit AcrB